MRKGQFMFKPGTLVLMLFIAVFGFLVYNWISGSVTDTGDQVIQDQSSAIECSRLDVDFLDLSYSENSTRISFRVNRDIEHLSARFEGGKNTTVQVHDIKRESIATASVNGTNYSEVRLKIDGCDQVFDYE
ncbi:MAG: hypothetical protein BRC27_01515 [Nanohaloarchaea archaeon SW_10_44_10]|nr:MAG: hypothetical protein BRC27_01515 [Nanohaloarchaea archaeon SW_10_44_10]